MKVCNALLKRILSLFTGFLMLYPLLSSAYASEITEGLKKTVDAVIEVVSNEELKKDEKKAERRALLRKIIGGKFNYSEMSRRALSKHWKKITPEEKKEFIELFGKLLENSYTKKIESYTNEKILYIEEKVRKNVALVKTIIEKGDDKIPVNYKLIKLANEWMVYDFIVEGVSLIKNYRSQFKKIIHKSSFQELVKKLKKKVEAISNGDSDKIS